jgi:2-desacetyl-2-hydroxyethyl bacteriochlorophyllide A dehydrogenase
MRALTIEGPGRYALRHTAEPEIGPDDVLMAPIAVGLCGTDLELLDGSMVYLRTGRAVFPIVPGHEWVAEVVELGARVEGLAVGDRVVGECSVGCGACDRCVSGAYHQCERRTETGVMGRGGALAGYLVLPATSVHRVPESVETEDAALTEPFAVALQAVLRSGFDGTHPALVIGGGTIGWLMAAILVERFGGDVAVAEPDPARRERLLELGTREAREGETFATVLEATGARQGVIDSIARLGDSGRLVAAGLSGAGPVPIDVDALVVRDQTIAGSLGSPGVWPLALEILASGPVRPSRLVTARFPLERVDEAIELARSGAAGKVLVFPGPDDRKRNGTADEKQSQMKGSGKRDEEQ